MPCSRGFYDMCHQKPVPSGSKVKSQSQSFSVEPWSRVCIRRRLFEITSTSKNRFLATLMHVTSVTDWWGPSSVSIISPRDVSDNFRSGRFVSILVSRPAKCQNSICSRISGLGHTMQPNTLGTLSFLFLYFLDPMYLLNIKSCGKLSIHPLFVFEFIINKVYFCSTEKLFGAKFYSFIYFIA